MKYLHCFDSEITFKTLNNKANFIPPSNLDCDKFLHKTKNKFKDCMQTNRDRKKLYNIKYNLNLNYLTFKKL